MDASTASSSSSGPAKKLADDDADRVEDDTGKKCLDGADLPEESIAGPAAKKRASILPYDGRIFLDKDRDGRFVVTDVHRGKKGGN